MGLHGFLDNLHQHVPISYIDDKSNWIERENPILNELIE
jgi:hypothetical protein